MHECVCACEEREVERERISNLAYRRAPLNWYVTQSGIM